MNIMIGEKVLTIANCLFRRPRSVVRRPTNNFHPQFGNSPSNATFAVLFEKRDGWNRPKNIL
jgi:hypothetical protein